MRTERKRTPYSIPAKHKSNDECFPTSCVIDHLGRKNYDKILEKWAKTYQHEQKRVQKKLSLQENRYVYCSVK